MEKAGGVEAPLQLATHPLLRAFIEEVTTARPAAAVHTEKKAPMAICALIAAFERAVLATTVPTSLRMCAWVQLVRAWGTLRFDDHRSMQPNSLRLLPTCPRATLTRTKTSGVGKKVQRLQMVIGRSAYIGEPTWLDVGFKLWEAVPQGRDCFLGLPATDMRTMRLIEARFADAAAMDHALLASLRTAASEPLFHVPSAIRFWTAHADRAFCPFNFRDDSRHKRRMDRRVGPVVRQDLHRIRANNPHPCAEDSDARRGTCPQAVHNVITRLRRRSVDRPWREHAQNW